MSISRLLANQRFTSDIVVGQAIGILTGTDLLNHRALHRPGKRNMAVQLLDSVTPVANGETRTVGVSMEIPIGH